MTRHYLINTLVNWRESIRKNDIQKAYNELRYMYGMTKAETLKTIRLYYDMGYKWYEYRHPKLRELLGEW
ncbi:hypothetical protein P4V72_30180 [Bacillus thuringiensis]|uniref:hypothetical protein n=1 Tax=Bacillus thuringiensis TaxID=1428 RepID=UPI0028409266|nr:hypothetical protein [Bacillus thuringiensis]MDR4148044.1 hypothetical protein [Bacillus thuringiensis]MEC3574839.1 hypothetical protein [Bacillus thuringiensis]MED2022559.1 hypothetical protein [Bacillus thuringiensis]MED2145370.1 hypothetical protein [Bacillus thuringiensis]MED2520852.1 hypothetical protein [Bacillus thuringiensis]